MKTDTKQNVPVLRFPEFAGEWEKRRFGDIYSFRSTNSFSRENLSYEYGKVKNIHYGDIHTKFSTAFRIEQEEAPYIAPDVNISKIPSSNYCQEGDLVIADASEDYDGVGTTIEIVELGKQPVLAGLHTILARPDLMPMALGFGGYAMQTPHIRQQIRFIAQGIKVLSLSARQLSATHIFIPSLPEQNKIATFLSAVDERIGLLKKKKEQLEAYKRGVMQQIFSRQLRFKDSEGKDYPDWKDQQLKKILFEHKAINKNQFIKEIFSVAKHKGVINQLDHMGRSYAAENTSNYKVVFPHDIVYTKSPTSEFPFGIIKQNKTGRTGVVSVLYAVYKPVNESIGLLLDAYFSSYIRTYNYLNPLVQKGAKNTMNIGNKAFLNGVAIALPSSPEEQQKIADFLGTIDKKLALCKKQITETEKFKKGLLQQMFV